MNEERAAVMEILKQLELHAPNWVPKIRVYILKLEGRKSK